MFIDPVDYIDEYCGSEYYSFLDAPLKEHVAAVLAMYCDLVKSRGDFTLGNQEHALRLISQKNIPVIVKKNIPSLIISFFDYLTHTGKIPGASAWRSDFQLIEKQFHSSIRDDGTVRGETQRNDVTATGRNDPCPCGSGKKFKKCCMALLG